MSLRAHIPWYARIAAKLALSRIPASYAFWHRHQLFSHGAMDQPEYAHGVFQHHLQSAGLRSGSGGFVGLELGPGDSALSALVAASYGATSYYLVDADRFVSGDIDAYVRMARYLAGRGLAPPDLTAAATLESILDRCHAQYLTEGLQSLRNVPTGCVNFVWSQAVLEHIRRDQFLPMMKEVRRILIPGGVCSHRVDLKDHLGGALNNLKVSSRWWEKEWMANSGFYTNRLRFSEMLHLFREAGFQCEVLRVKRWDVPPLDRRSMAAEFRQLSDDDLLVQDFDVLLC